MNTRLLWSNILVILGIIAMLIGILDPLEGSFIILPGSGMAALGAFLGKSRYRVFLYWAFSLIAVGVGAMVVLSMFGGVGGKTGRSMWWLLVVLPCPVGWIMGLIGAILKLIESFKEGHTPSSRRIQQ